MKQAEYQSRLDLAEGDPRKTIEVICEQIADVNAALQTFVRVELDRVQNEILLIRSDIDRIRVTTANTIQGSVGNVEINLKLLVQRFDAYEKRSDKLATTLADAVTERIRASDILRGEIDTLVHDVEAIKHDE